MLIGTVGQHIFYTDMNSIKCPHCGLTNWATDETCKRCKQSLHAALNAYGSYSNDQYAQPPYGQQQYAQQPYGNPSYQHGYHQAGKQKQGIAITSMALGIASFPLTAVLIGLLLAPIAFILGIVGVVKANRRPNEYGGKGFAIAGIAVSSVVMFLFVPIIAAIAIPNILAAKRAANDASALRALSTIYASQTTYRTTTGESKCGDMDKLSSIGLIPANLSKGEYNGYRFSVVMVDGFSCEMHAMPASMSSGNRSFMAGSYDGVIHAADKKGGPATSTDPRLDADNGYPGQARRY